MKQKAFELICRDAMAQKRPFVTASHNAIALRSEIMSDDKWKWARAEMLEKHKTFLEALKSQLSEGC